MHGNADVRDSFNVIHSCRPYRSCHIAHHQTVSTSNFVDPDFIRIVLKNPFHTKSLNPLEVWLMKAHLMRTSSVLAPVTLCVLALTAAGLAAPVQSPAPANETFSW